MRYTTKVTLSSQATLGNFGRVWTSDVIGDHHVSFTMHLAVRFNLSCGVTSYHSCGVMSSRSYTFITAIPSNHLFTFCTTDFLRLTVDLIHFGCVIGDQLVKDPLVPAPALTSNVSLSPSTCNL